MPTDEDDLQSVATGKYPASTDPEQWLEAHGNLLYRFALTRVQDEHVAEDLVQDTLLSAIPAFEYFEHKSSVQTWLVGILRNKIADHFKRAGRRPASEPADDAILAALLQSRVSNSEFKSRIERTEFMAAFQNCFHQLPITMAESFLLRFRDECSVDDLSNKFEISKSNVSVRLFRARLLLRKCLERVWLGETAKSSKRKGTK